MMTEEIHALPLSARLEKMRKLGIGTRKGQEVPVQVITRTIDIGGVLAVLGAIFTLALFAAFLKGLR